MTLTHLTYSLTYCLTALSLLSLITLTATKDTALCLTGSTCTDQHSCPSFLRDKAAWSRLTQGTEEWDAALSQLKENICNAPDKRVCCSQCDLTSGACLPALGACGLSGGEHRVVGGTKAIPGEFPFTALLGRLGRRKDCRLRGCPEIEVTIWNCGGTLINRRYVVTAAHCHSSRSQVGLVRLGEYQVTESRARDCTQDGVCLPTPQDFSILPEDVTLHPQFGTQIQNGIRFIVNDIALIRLPSLAMLTLSVAVVCLPLDPATTAASLNVPDLGAGLAGYYPHVVGWGHTDPDPYSREVGDGKERVASSIQQKLEIPILNDEDCSAKMRGWKPRGTHICAGGEVGKDSCSGDSGGPLYMKHIIQGTNKSATYSTSTSEPWVLLGITSFGTRTCGIGRPAVYTRVEEFIPWIVSVIKD